MVMNLVHWQEWWLTDDSFYKQRIGFDVTHWAPNLPVCVLLGMELLILCFEEEFLEIISSLHNS